MAGTLKLAKLSNQIWRSYSAHPAVTVTVLLNFRSAHTSTYDKNDEDLSQNVVIDEANQTHSEKYWGPHPKTGVFGPITEQSKEGAASSSPANGGKESIMEETAWFRPTSIEDHDKSLQS